MLLHVSFLEGNIYFPVWACVLSVLPGCFSGEFECSCCRDDQLLHSRHFLLTGPTLPVVLCVLVLTGLHTFSMERAGQFQAVVKVGFKPNSLFAFFHEPLRNSKCIFSWFIKHHNDLIKHNIRNALNEIRSINVRLVPSSWLILS